MKHSFFYLTLLLGLVCWSIPEAGAKDDDKKLSKAEKRELKKQEKEARKAAKNKGKKNADAEEDEDEDNGKKKKKADKKAVSNAWKGLKPDFGKLKANGKFFIYAEYTTLTEAGEGMLNKLVESDREFKAAKVNVLLINCESVEEETACKMLKKMKCKLPMVMKSQKLEEEELPLAEEVEGKQAARREILGERRKKSGIKFLASAIPTVAFIVLAIVFGFKNLTVRDNRFIPATIAFAALSVVTFFIFLAFSNKFINACRIYNKNEKVSSTEEGERLLEIREYKDLYGALLIIEEYDEEEAEEETDEE